MLSVSLISSAFHVCLTKLGQRLKLCKDRHNKHQNQLYYVHTYSFSQSYTQRDTQRWVNIELLGGEIGV